MKLSSITPAQIDAAPLSRQQRDQIIGQLYTKRVEPRDLDLARLEAAGVDATVAPAVLFQARAACLDTSKTGPLKDTAAVLDALAQRGLWNDASPSSDLAYDDRVQQTAKAFADIVANAEGKGTIGREDKGKLDELVEQYLLTRPPSPDMTKRVPDLTAMKDPRVVSCGTTGMGGRVYITDGGKPGGGLTLYTMLNGGFVEEGEASGHFSPNGMVAFGYLDYPTTQKLISIVERALPSAVDTSGEMHPALSAASEARSAYGFLREMHDRLSARAESLVAEQRASVENIRSVEHKLLPTSEGTWFAAEPITLPMMREGLTIPEGAELWSYGRHPAELENGSVRAGLYIRHNGQLECVQYYPAYTAWDNRYVHAWMATQVVGPSDPRLPSHWRADEKPATQTSTYPKNAGHAIMKVGLDRMAKPTITKFDGCSFTVQPEGAAANALGSITVVETPQGSSVKDWRFTVQGWRLESQALEDHDHGTLSQLLAVAQSVAKLSGANAPRAERFRAAVQAALDKREADPMTQAMRPFVEAGFTYPMSHLRLLIERGISPAELGKVKERLHKTCDVRDAEGFAQRAVELVRPQEVVVTDATIDELLASGRNAKKDWIKGGAIIASVVRGAVNPTDINSMAGKTRGHILAALLGDTETAAAAGMEQAQHGHRIAGWAILGAAATTPETRRTAFELVAKWLDTDWIDMAGAVIPTAALLATGAERAVVEAKADEKLFSDYWKISSGALLAKALCARTSEAKQAVFDLALERVYMPNRRKIIMSLAAMALTANTPEQKAKVLGIAREHTFDDWHDEVRSAAYVALAIVTCKDESVKRRATMAVIDD